MARIETFELRGTTNANELEKDIKGLSDATQDLTQDYQDFDKKATKALKDVDKESKQTQKSVKGVSAGFKALGTAIKATGIGLLVGVIAKLGEAFSQNQKVVDAFSSAMETINIIFADVTNAIISAYESSKKATGGFDALGKVISGLITIQLTPLKLLFYGIKLAIQELQLAWEKSFFGDKDQSTIEQLNANIKETQQNLIEVGVNALKAGKDIVSNFTEAISEVGNIGASVVDEISKVDVASSRARAKALVESRKNAELAEARLQGLIEKYDILAEQQRQIRDDERLSLREREEANNKLNEILQEQLEKQLELAQQRVNNARLEISAGDTRIEKQKELIQAENELLAVKAQVTGFESEQIKNEETLQQERKDNLNEIAKINKDEFELRKIEAEQTLEQQTLLIQKTIEDEIEKNEALENARQAHETALTEIEAEQQELRNKQKQDADAKQIKLDKAVADARIQLADAVGGALNGLSAIAGENAGIQKAIGIAQATIDTFIGANKALAQGGIVGGIAAAGIIATGLANVSTILSTPIPNAKGGQVNVGASQI
ncbi:MAG: hypothetical protein HRU18_27715, partial [Pseudoalteromonas sp.]|uniref:hypothetical protein n=1 Tax=Pseudoalteromonas sp. TaxID=53249 RepID=UPI001DD4E9E5